MNNQISTRRILKCTEAHLLRHRGIEHKISLSHRLSNKVMRAIMEIEQKAFRPELRYSREELSRRMKEENFLVIMVYVSGSPVGFAMGYREPQEAASFYMDTLATVIEKKRIGSTLFHLTSILCFKQGFHHVTVRTEEKDDRERSPKKFYEKLGFYQIPCDPCEGIGMRKDLDQQTINEYIHHLCVE